MRRLAYALILTASPALAAETTVSHGISAFGDLKYGPDFTHFDYVNPDAPKGGAMRTTPVYPPSETFDSLNAYILKGDAAAGFEANGNLVFDTLMTSAIDEPDSVYGLLAKTIEYPADRSWAAFELRPEARFSDGTPVTADDVVFSLDILKEKGAPQYQTSLRDVTAAVAENPHRVRYTFDAAAPTRDLPMLVAGLPVFSKADWAGRDFAESSLTPPIGSGPYAVDTVIAGRSIGFKRRPDYWAADLPANRGRWNFDRISFEYYRDQNATLEALSGGEIDFIESYSSKAWATQFDFPAVKDGRVIRDQLPDRNPSGMQGFWFNTRRPHLADPRVREAIGMAFDFEWSNKTLFYGIYSRAQSFFENSALKAEGEPSPEELALLEPFRGQIPDEVFGPPYTPPVTDGSGRNRDTLRAAGALLDAAGWPLKDGKRTNAQGAQLRIEFLETSQLFERIINPFVKNLERLGIEATLRMVDPAQYQRRVEDLDFDLVSRRYALSATPSVGLRTIFGSAGATTKGTYNMAGVNDPAVDALSEQVIGAADRQSLTVAGRALDRVLRAGRYWVPQWYKASHNIAYWNRFGRPDRPALYARGELDTWWFDMERDATLKASER